ncbi:MAG TPA: excinuclease ABC subunit UvrC, partial [bacterium]|nr:excinuclease ABC subunit UvrC [bacterium]
RFNVIMRDSKSYPWVAIFYSENFPRIRVLRNPEKFSQENTFIGPFTDKKEILRILRDLRKIFPYCSCKKPVRKKKRPCLYFQLSLCPGPCFTNITENEYRENIKKIELFLKGETQELKKKIEGKMLSASKNQDFEIAAFWRNKLEAIDHATDKQHVLMDHKTNKDIIGFYNEDKYMATVIIHIREGRIFNKSSFTFNLKEKLIQKNEILNSILEQFYQDFKTKLPDLIIIQQLNKRFKLLESFLRDIKEDFEIKTPSDEYEISLLRIANKNAEVMVNQEIQMEEIKMDDKDFREKILEETKELLNLPSLPRIIEGFDISNIEGLYATGSMVYFLNGKPYNKNYRHFNIRSKSTPDDVAMMKEVIRRRYSMLLEQNLQLPDLILVDGGKGQLNAGVSVLNNLGLNIPIIGLAKKFEEVYLPNRKESIDLPKNSPTLKLFQRIRNEAHRFSIKLHKKQRKKRIITSVLDDIKGVGPATRTKLLNKFGSVGNIKKVSIEDLSQIVNKKLAEVILKVLNNQ